MSVSSFSSLYSESTNLGSPMLENVAKESTVLDSFEMGESIPVQVCLTPVAGNNRRYSWANALKPEADGEVREGFTPWVRFASLKRRSVMYFAYKTKSYIENSTTS